MPSGLSATIHPVLEFLRDIQPLRILEIGIGHGKYGVLIREYLEIAYERYSRSEWQLELVGIEVFERYRSPLWDYAYDHVMVADVRYVDLAALKKFDCCLLLDVIEHFDHEGGHLLLKRLLDSCDYVIVSTPLQFLPQGALFGNEAERHRSLWSRRDYRRYHFKYRKCQDGSVAVLSRHPLKATIGQAASKYFKVRAYFLRTLPPPVIKLICGVKSLIRRRFSVRTA